MNKFFKSIVTIIASGAAKILLFRKKPEIIAITGSAGKTTTKEFLRELLEIDFEVMSPAEGYNTELGAPLAIFGEKAPVKLFSPAAWLITLFKLYKKALFIKDFPDKIIVEMGADKPGDIRFLAKVFPPSKAIILSVLPTHLEEFKTVEAVAKEKLELVKAVPEGGRVYLNEDDEKVKEMARLAKAQVVYFGTKGTSGYLARNLVSDLKGLKFYLKLKDKNIPMAAPIFGRQMIYPLLAAIAVARSEHIALDKIQGQLKTLKPFKGRMNIIEGINNSIIIDDSYNANPGSMISALEFIKEQKGRKIAVLGNMNELGDYEEEAHRIVGKKASESVNILITVGEAAEKYLAAEAKKEGLKEIKSFKTSEEAGEWLEKNIKPGDIVLGKGSQNKVRIERTIERIMAHPEDKEKVLVRQSDFWKER